MHTTKADALVFFGATGDLAFKKIFPALQSMEQIEFLDMPIIAVTRGGRRKEDLLRDRNFLPSDSRLTRYSGTVPDPSVSSRASIAS